MKEGLIFALCAIFLTGCLVMSHQVKETSLMTSTPKQYSIEEVEKIARIEIPAAASEVQFYAVTGWLDDAALIKFAIPPDDLDIFLKRYGFGILESGYWSIQEGPPTVAWWPKFGSIPTENYLGGKQDFPGYSQSILVDVTNSDLYVVYFQCFED